jgi:hypothetical protein
MTSPITFESSIILATPRQELAKVQLQARVPRSNTPAREVIAIVKAKHTRPQRTSKKRKEHHYPKLIK